MRHEFIAISILVSAVIAAIAQFTPAVWHAFWIAGPLIALGVVDMTQKRHAVRRNFPVIGHGRYLMELVRPEINQYFVESNTDGAPFNREQRSIVYQRAKNTLDTVPFGTQFDVYETGYEWINHSLAPKEIAPEPPRVVVGESTCAQPYASSLLNVSAMSYGSLSRHAILALNTGARLGKFAHNTGEGGLSPYHLEPGGDVIWQIGTGYFGCRAENGGFDAEKFKASAAHPRVKMIEVKLSQGAKPGHGGILPAKKVTPEIAAIRGVPLGRDVISPPAHSAFTTPLELCQFVTRLRELAGGKPIGLKLCIGKRREFLALGKAMAETGLHPDYITIDGGEGGTGAAPLEFSNYLGSPLTEALVFAHSTLVGFNLREKVRLFAAGKIVTGFGLARVIALGADGGNSARGMMFALGCIQARRCNSNHCPVGVATQNPELMRGLVVDDKAPRVYNFHRATIHALMEIVAAAGMRHPGELRPWHIFRRLGPTEVRHYGELFDYLAPGALLRDDLPPAYARAMRHARADSFDSGGAA